MKKLIMIYFTDTEYGKVKQITSKSIVKEAQILEMMIEKGLKEMRTQRYAQGKLIFQFEDKERDKGGKNNKAVYLDERLHDEMTKICKCTGFTMSFLAKYFIMPQIEAALGKGEWNYIL